MVNGSSSQYNFLWQPIYIVDKLKKGQRKIKYNNCLPFQTSEQTDLLTCINVFKESLNIFNS